MSKMIVTAVKTQMKLHYTSATRRKSSFKFSCFIPLK